jgi:hypothetical protein
MEEPTTPQPFAAAAQHTLNPFTSYHPHPVQQTSVSFASQLDPSLQALDSSDAFAQHFHTQLGSNHGAHLQVGSPYQEDEVPPQFQQLRSHPTPPRKRQKQVSQFGVLTPTTPHHNYLQQDGLDDMQQDNEALREEKTSHFGNLKSIPNPPDLQAWRERLFNVDKTITLSEDECVN